MKKQRLLIVAGITAITFASCGGAEENPIPNEGSNEMMEMGQPDEDEYDYSSDVDEMKSSDESSTSDEWNEVLDGYEDYVDDYVAIIKKQKADPSDMTIMTKYQELMQKGSIWTAKMSEMSSDFGAEQLTRMLEIQSKLASAAL